MSNGAGACPPKYVGCAAHAACLHHDLRGAHDGLVACLEAAEPSSGEDRARHCRASACHLYLSFDRMSSNMAFVSGREPQDLMMARTEQKQARHTQHVLRALPLLIMLLRGIEGPQSTRKTRACRPPWPRWRTSHNLRLSAVGGPLRGGIVPVRATRVESCHSANSSLGVGLSEPDAPEPDMARGTQTRVRRGKQVKLHTQEKRAKRKYGSTI